MLGMTWRTTTGRHCELTAPFRCHHEQRPSADTVSRKLPFRMTVRLTCEKAFAELELSATILALQKEMRYDARVMGDDISYRTHHGEAAMTL